MSYFKAKMHQIRFPLGLCPGPRWGSLQRSSDPLSCIWGGVLLREGGRVREDLGGKGKKRGGKGRERENFWLRHCNRRTHSRQQKRNRSTGCIVYKITHLQKPTSTKTTTTNDNYTLRYNTTLSTPQRRVYAYICMVNSGKEWQPLSKRSQCHHHAVTQYAIHWRKNTDITTSSTSKTQHSNNTIYATSNTPRTNQNTLIFCLFVLYLCSAYLLWCSRIFSRGKSIIMLKRKSATPAIWRDQAHTIKWLSRNLASESS